MTKGVHDYSIVLEQCNLIDSLRELASVLNPPFVNQAVSKVFFRLFCLLVQVRLLA